MPSVVPMPPKMLYLFGRRTTQSGFRLVQGVRTDTNLSVWVSAKEDYDYDTDTITTHEPSSSLPIVRRRAVLWATSIPVKTSLRFETLSEVVHFPSSHTGLTEYLA